MSKNKPNFVFFGTSEFAIKILQKLIKSGHVPSLVITTPDKPQGRKMVMTPPPVKVFAEKHNLKIAQPVSLSTYNLPPTTYHLFIVAAYGKIIPKSVLEIPKFGTLNVHPSLLPKFRGPSPIQSFILSGEEKTGVTIMLMDKLVDHGPILKSENLKTKNEKLNSIQLEEELAKLGGEILIDVIPKWINEKITPTEQDHSQATFTKKIEKKDGLVDLEKDPPETIFRKFLAFQPWPGIYYFLEKNGSPMFNQDRTPAKQSKKTRIIITDMELYADDKLVIKKVKPEGKKEMGYQNFLKMLC